MHILSAATPSPSSFLSLGTQSCFCLWPQERHLLSQTPWQLRVPMWPVLDNAIHAEVCGGNAKPSAFPEYRESMVGFVQHLPAFLSWQRGWHLELEVKAAKIRRWPWSQCLGSPASKEETTVLICRSHSKCPGVLCVCVFKLSRIQLFGTPWTADHQAPLSFPGKNTGVGCHALLQGIFPTQGSNSHLLHCRQILYQCNTQGSYWQPTHS